VRKVILLAFWALLTAGILLFANCSNPLEITGQDGLAPVGPVTEVDTVYSVDTLTMIDTLTIVDTLTEVDTVIIVEPDPGQPQTVCSILLANLREIIWMFHNQEGEYRLEFVASQSREFCMYTLLVDIDGQQFQWDLVDGAEFVQVLYLNEYATIRVTPDQPLLLGHQVDLCLTISIPDAD
jgi:hypothetical protein